MTEPASNTEFVLKTEECVEGMRQLAEASVDLVVTSPPYNLGIQYGIYDHRISRNDYLEWSQKWLPGLNNTF